MFPADYNNPVCVFCGSSPGTSPIYATAAQAVGAALANERVPLVFGGARRGLMGVVSQSVLQAGGLVHGVLVSGLLAKESNPATKLPSGDATPTSYAPASAEGLGPELFNEDYGGRFTIEVARSMHERKATMAQLSTGGFVVLPGGFGTLEELLEMVTWNQLGVHRLPVVVLNIGNFFTPLQTLFETAVSSGFIKPENTSLVQIVNLGDAEANADETRAHEWGAVAIQALREWSPPENAGYKLNWEDSKASKTQESQSAPSPAQLNVPSPFNAASPAVAPSPAAAYAPSPAATFAPSPSPAPAPVQARDPYHPALSAPNVSGTKPALLSTGRYTSSGGPVTPQNLPLWDLHLQRLRGAHSHFAARDKTWGSWPGDENVWEKVKKAIEAQGGVGDWRVRMLVRPDGVEVQALPCTGMPPFAPLPTDNLPRRRVILDPTPTTVEAGEAPYRLFKTEHRKAYVDAAGRVGDGEVLMHDGSRLLETATANIAIRVPTAQGWEWVTPRLERTPFLTGTMRKYLFEQGVLREGSLGVEDWERARREGWRVIGFNGFWGVWEAEI